MNRSGRSFLLVLVVLVLLAATAGGGGLLRLAPLLLQFLPHHADPVRLMEKVQPRRQGQVHHLSLRAGTVGRNEGAHRGNPVHLRPGDRRAERSDPQGQGRQSDLPPVPLGKRARVAGPGGAAPRGPRGARSRGRFLRRLPRQSRPRIALGPRPVAAAGAVRLLPQAARSAPGLARVAHRLAHCSWCLPGR